MRRGEWTTPADLRAKVEQYWSSGRLLAAPLAGESIYPLVLKLRRPGNRDLSERFAEVRAWIRELESAAGYEIEWTQIHHRVLGANRVPLRVSVPDERHAFTLIGKAEDAERFREAAARILERVPGLASWIIRKPLATLERCGEWDRILDVLIWFRDHPRSGLYLRQLDIPGVDTKFIEARIPLLTELLDLVLPPAALEQGTFARRYGLTAKPRQVRFRVLDPRLAIQGLTDLAVRADEFAQLHLPVERVFITENEINGLAFPLVPASMVIFGLGYGLERLSGSSWLREPRLLYWGDIDTYGFHMLDRLRSAWPDAASFLMDRETLLAHQALWVREDSPYDGDLHRLTTAENALYKDLRRHRYGVGVRLEQERIPYAWVERALRSLK